jgi:hypothetical protein
VSELLEEVALELGRVALGLVLQKLQHLFHENTQRKRERRGEREAGKRARETHADANLGRFKAHEEPIVRLVCRNVRGSSLGRDG